MLLSIFCKTYLAVFWVKNVHFSNFFGENIFKNHPSQVLLVTFSIYMYLSFTYLCTGKCNSDCTGKNLTVGKNSSHLCTYICTYVCTLANGQKQRNVSSIIFPPRLPDFSWYKIPKRENISKWPTNIPNDHKIYPMAIEYTKWI
jgi:hypothetical protein